MMKDRIKMKEWKKELRTITLNLIFALLSGISYAAIIRVPSDQPTIQAAINKAQNGDTVKVAAGVL